MKFASKHAALLLAVAAVTAPAVIAQCPNLRAINRPGRWDSSETGTRCMKILNIFGLRIGLSSSFCPDVRYFYPPRRDCMVFMNCGTDCEKIGEVALERWECKCTSSTDIDLGVVEESCDCTLAGDEGLFDDHTTIPCVNV